MERKWVEKVSGSDLKKIFAEFPGVLDRALGSQVGEQGAGLSRVQTQGLTDLVDGLRTAAQGIQHQIALGVRCQALGYTLGQAL